jgi:hypothetical protein
LLPSSVARFADSTRVKCTSSGSALRSTSEKSIRLGPPPLLRVFPRGQRGGVHRGCFRLRISAIVNAQIAPS